MSTFTRRELMRALGITSAGAGLLAACGGGGDGAGGATTGAGSTPRAGAAAGSQGSVRVGYLPITDAAPLLIAHAQGIYTAEGLEAPRPTLLRSWAQVAEAFQARQVDVVHILMPTAVWMRFSQSFPVKVVAWDHTDGSAFTVANRINSYDDLAGETVAVPFWYSIHNVVLQMMLRRANLTPITKGDASRAERTVKLVVMAPPDMPPAIATGSIAGYIVAEPFNAMAEVNKVGKIQRFTGDIWLNHACCVVIMHEDDTVQRPQWAQAVINSVAKAQVFLRENRQESARILSQNGGNYLPQPLPVIERALSHYDRAEYGGGAIQHPDWGNARIDFQPFPFPTYTEELVRLLKETAVEGDNAFLQRLDPAQAHGALVDDRFARAAIVAAGGTQAFGVAEGLSRTETIAV
jgi:NitT/TauT family transport system substrate-binding protein